MVKYLVIATNISIVHMRLYRVAANSLPRAHFYVTQMAWLESAPK